MGLLSSTISRMACLAFGASNAFAESYCSTVLRQHMHVLWCKPLTGQTSNCEGELVTGQHSRKQLALAMHIDTPCNQTTLDRIVSTAATLQSYAEHRATSTEVQVSCISGNNHFQRFLNAAGIALSRRLWTLAATSPLAIITCSHMGS